MTDQTAGTDHELLAQVGLGDTAALDGLFTRYYARLYSFLARWTGDSHVAEDLVQELFLKLLRLPTQTLKGEALPWLYRLARNLAVDRYRQQQDGDQMQLEPDVRDQRPLALEQLAQEERAHQVEAVLAGLPPHHREVLLLRGIEGLGHREIGLIINCSEGAARVRLHRATAAFRLEWQTRHGDER